MPTPSEQLNEIKESLGDLPQRLAAVLSTRIPTAALAPPSIQRSPPPGIPTAAPAPGLPPPPLPEMPAPAAPPPLPKKYPKMPEEPPELPEWWKPQRDSQRNQKRQGMGWANFLNTPLNQMYDFESPEQQQGWQKQERQAVRGWRKAENQRAEREWNAGLAGVNQLGAKPAASDVLEGPGEKKSSEGTADLSEVVDLLTEIRDELKKMNERPREQAGPMPPSAPGSSPGFRTVYQAAGAPAARGGQSSSMGRQPLTGAGGPQKTQKALVTAKQLLGM